MKVQGHRFMNLLFYVPQLSGSITPAIRVSGPRTKMHFQSGP